MNHRPNKTRQNAAWLRKQESIEAYQALLPLLQDGTCEAPIGYRFNRLRLRTLTEEQQVCIGRFLVRRYRKQTRTTGAINWKDFQAWCTNHWKALLAIKVFVTLLLLFCL